MTKALCLLAWSLSWAVLQVASSLERFGQRLAMSRLTDRAMFLKPTQSWKNKWLGE